MKKVILLLLTTVSFYGQILERITPTNASNVYSFGDAISHFNNDFVIGGYDGILPTGNFRYYAFEKNINGFVQNQIIACPEIGQNFGTSLDIENDFLFIGSPNNSYLIQNGGAVYIYKKTAGIWNFLTKIQPSNLSTDEQFGTSVHVYNNQVFIGAINYDSNGNATDNNGAIYVFDKSGDSFTFNQIISVNYNKNLGQFIDIENNFMICTNTNSTNGETNVLSYEKQSNSWNLVNNFNVGNLGENKNLKVNYSNNQLFVSKDGWPNSNPITRGIEIYNLQGNNWVYETIFNHAIGDYTEASINVENNIMVVSALGFYILQMERKNTSVYYKKINNNWTFMNTLMGQSGVDDDNFGYLNKIKGNVIVFGNSQEIWGSPFGPINGGAYSLDTTLSSQAFDLEKINIFPNPVKEVLLIENPNNLQIKQITLIDANGRILYSSSSLSSIDFSGFSSGIYFLKTNFEDGNIYTKKILKN
ncbi:T9SS type A sorting domain-containing protein [Flavobacterium sp.]|uniref:T9SS type A sorting domain-containing protein n=1 Tax=Flavobacterium sp. TaxID=239 RepID=UPI0008CC0CA2|nr:T9SS type A sorting domain-containing protein [Flavobacterium sp.]OGS61920.1 MAG: hypothetical protein A2X07_04150 [Flavobacteria bacterium GWF1_32_7]HBD26650.1 hypothetical protein [Flavobacterium sp.]